MSKRFRIEYIHDESMDGIIDTTTEEMVFPFTSILPLCDLLNKLNDENQQLIKALTVDNKVTTEEVYFLLQKAVSENVKLETENEQLKATIKEAYNNERTMIGKSVLKQLMETIQ